MKRRNFNKILALSCLGLGLDYKTYAQAYPISELLGKKKPDPTGIGGLRWEVSQAFENMQQEAKKSNIAIYPISAYRSYQRQAHIWNTKYKKYRNQGLSPEKTIKKIIEYSTLPGTSRHHWGTDVDVVDAQVHQPRQPLSARHFHGEGVYVTLQKWLEENAEKFDFYLVYTDNPQRKGFHYEPWHLSYKPLSVEMLSQFKKLNHRKILTESQLLGQEHFTDDFIHTYREENILDINPMLL